MTNTPIATAKGGRKEKKGEEAAKKVGGKKRRISSCATHVRKLVKVLSDEEEIVKLRREHIKDNKPVGISGPAVKTVAAMVDDMVDVLTRKATDVVRQAGEQTLTDRAFCSAVNMHYNQAMAILAAQSGQFAVDNYTNSLSV